jgi:hypothetical protein
MLHRHALLPLQEFGPIGAVLSKQANPPLQEPGPTEPALLTHASPPSHDFAAMAAELPAQDFELMHELAATEPLLLAHARNWLHDFAAMAAELLSQASWPLQEPAPTEPVLSVQASGPVQLVGGLAFEIPADPIMTNIPQRTAATSHIRLFMFDPHAPCLNRPKKRISNRTSQRQSRLPLFESPPTNNRAALGRANN